MPCDHSYSSSQQIPPYIVSMLCWVCLWTHHIIPFFLMPVLQYINDRTFILKNIYGQENFMLCFFKCFLTSLLSFLFHIIFSIGLLGSLENAIEWYMWTWNLHLFRTLLLFNNVLFSLLRLVYLFLDLLLDILLPFC